MMELFVDPEAIEKYLEVHSSPEPDLLRELSGYTYRNIAYPQMISGPVQGALLRMISMMIRPERILEIGTFTGYSAICLAAGLIEGGKLLTIEINDELAEVSREYFIKAGLDTSIDLIVGDALQVIPTLVGYEYNLVFIDGNKENYPEYYNLIIDLVPPGGFIIVDNVLWGGKVIDDSARDSATEAIRLFNRQIIEDLRVENLLLPIRDGLMLIRKK